MWSQLYQLEWETTHPDPNISEIINALYQTILQINAPQLSG